MVESWETNASWFGLHLKNNLETSMWQMCLTGLTTSVKNNPRRAITCSSRQKNRIPNIYKLNGGWTHNMWRHMTWRHSFPYHRYIFILHRNILRMLLWCDLPLLSSSSSSVIVISEEALLTSATQAWKDVSEDVEIKGFMVEVSWTFGLEVFPLFAGVTLTLFP